MSDWKSRLDPQTTPEQKMDNFNNALRKIVRVSHGEMNQMLEEDRRAKADKPKRGPKPKTSASDRA